MSIKMSVKEEIEESIEMKNKTDVSNSTISKSNVSNLTISEYLSAVENASKETDENNNISTNNSFLTTTPPFIDGNNGKVSYVTSNVGHPMLVINFYTFHKHSINQRTGRINWRCSKRRVKDIKCSSSCYMINGSVSEPTPHNSKCYPINCLKNMKYKRARIMNNSSINTKADSWTTLKKKNGTSSYESMFTDNFTFENYDVNDQMKVDDSTVYKYNEFESNSDDECMYLDLNYNDPEITNTENNFSKYTQANPITSDYYEDSSLSEVKSLNDDYKIQQTIPSSQLFDPLKNSEESCILELKNTKQAFQLSKRSSNREIQILKWKMRMMEIDMLTLKVNLSRKNSENESLRKIVNEMILKINSDDRDQACTNID